MSCSACTLRAIGTPRAEQQGPHFRLRAHRVRNRVELGANPVGIRFACGDIEERARLTRTRRFSTHAS